MQRISPYLWFDTEAGEAVKFYTSIFKNSAIDTIEEQEGKVFSVVFHLAGLEFLAINGGPEFKPTPAISFFVMCETEKEADTLWTELSAGGSVMMEYKTYPFAKKYGWLNDRFGFSWQVMLSEKPQQILPCLMFIGENAGRAEAAMTFYTRAFDHSSIQMVDRYTEADGDKPGLVKHGRFVIENQDFIAMDSSLSYDFNFTPAVSFFIACEGQAEVDYFWERLSHGGKEGMCGWLEDHYGVSWQVIPDTLGRLLGDKDREKAERVRQAMLKMKKINVDELEAAYRGEKVKT